MSKFYIYDMWHKFTQSWCSLSLAKLKKIFFLHHTEFKSYACLTENDWKKRLSWNEKNIYPSDFNN